MSKKKAVPGSEGESSLSREDNVRGSGPEASAAEFQEAFERIYEELSKPEARAKSRALQGYLDALVKRYPSLSLRHLLGAHLQIYHNVDAHISARLSPKLIDVTDDPKTWEGVEDAVELLAKHPVAAVLGLPGGGKTTLVQYLVRRLATRISSKEKRLFGDKVPIPLIVRDLDLDGVDTWERLLSAFGKWVETSLGLPEAERTVLSSHLRELAGEGRLFLFVDGFDEAQDAHQNEFVRALLDFQVGTFGLGNRILLTSRRVGYSANPLLIPNPEANSVTLRRRRVVDILFDAGVGRRLLDTEEELPGVLEGEEENPDDSPERHPGRLIWEVKSIKRADLRQGEEKRNGNPAPIFHLTPFTDSDVKQYAVNWFRATQQDAATGGQLSQEFCARVAEVLSLQEMARLPQMLALMCVVFLGSRALPNGRAELFEKVTQVYLDHIPVAAKRMNWFDVSKAREWLARIGYEMQKLRSGEESERTTSAKESDVLTWIQQEIDRTAGSLDDARVFLDFAKRRGGMLLEAGPNQLSFLHLSFQEYFAAKYLKENLRWIDSTGGRFSQSVSPSLVSKNEAIERFKSRTWEEVTVLLFEMYSHVEALEAFELLSNAVDNGVRNSEHSVETVGQEWRPLTRALSRVVLDPLSSLTAKLRTEASQWILQLDGVWQERVFHVEGFSTKQIPLFDIVSILLYFFESDGDASHAVDGFRHLDLESEPVMDVGPLEYLTELETLNLSKTQVRDVTALRSLTKLETLNLSKTQVRDMADLRNLTSLVVVNLSNTQVQDVTGLGKLAKLERLSLSHTQVNDVTELRNLTELQWLDLSNTQVRDIAELRHVTNLRWLNLSNTQVEDVTELGKLTNLEWLSLAYTQVRDVAELRHLTKLKALYLSNTQVEDVTALRSLTELQWLYLSNTQVKDVTELRNLTKLQWLDLSNTLVKDVTELRSLTDLRFLDLSNTQVRDVTELRHLTKLEWLGLSSTNVEDVTELRSLTNLLILR